MRIKKIHIQNFKSLVDFELHNPKPFCAFVGPNASGKSNIFEALEFVNYVVRYKYEAANFFGGKKNIFSFNSISNRSNYDAWQVQSFSVEFNTKIILNFNLRYPPESESEKIGGISWPVEENKINLFEHSYFEREENEEIKLISKKFLLIDEFELFINKFSRFFVGKADLVRLNSPSEKLKTDASNLSQIIGQIFQSENKREDFIEWLQILIPEFENIEVKQSNIDGSFEFFVYEKSSSSKPFPRHLLSDGTKNILALMAAVYQSDEPQFLCIEEPENGLHPQAIELLVDFFREKCETQGHHIWLNTHSQTLVRCMEIDEIILVNKIDGRTTAKPASAPKGINIKTDEAWLSNALGGGVL